MMLLFSPLTDLSASPSEPLSESLSESSFGKPSKTTAAALLASEFTPLPLPQIVDVPFTNPFPEDCVFALSLIQPPAATDAPAKPGQRPGKSSDGGVTSWSGLPNRAFWVKGGRDKVKAVRGQTLNVQLTFLPFRFVQQVPSTPAHAPARPAHVRSAREWAGRATGRATGRDSVT
jgi:hypothetical protein